MNDIIKLELPKMVFEALRRYKAKHLAPWPNAYRKGNGSAGHDKRSGQEIEADIVELIDHNGDVLAEYWELHNGGKPQFIVGIAKQQWFA